MKKINYFVKTFQIIDKKRKKWTYLTLAGIFIVTFSLFYFSGRYAVQYQPDIVNQFLKTVSEQSIFIRFLDLFEEGKFLYIFGLILSHNLSVALIDFVLGTTFIFPIFSIIANGVFSGFLSGISYYTAKASLIQIVGFYLVLVLELIATILVLVEGMYLSYSAIFPEKIWKIKSRKESFRRTFNQNILVLVLSVLILLFAAIIETVVIYSEWVSGVTPVPF